MKSIKNEKKKQMNTEDTQMNYLGNHPKMEEASNFKRRKTSISAHSEKPLKNGGKKHL